MLIDTNQIVSLTNLRLSIGEMIREVESGRVFLLSKKGEIKAALVPVSYIGQTADRVELQRRIDKLQSRVSQGLANNKKIWKSEKALRDLRKKRIGKLALYQTYA